MIDPHGQRLAKAIQAGDRGAFEELFDHFFDRIHAYARARTPSSEAAARVTEQVLATALESIHDYDARTEVNGWMLSILNRVLEHGGAARASSGAPGSPHS